MTLLKDYTFTKEKSIVSMITATNDMYLTSLTADDRYHYAFINKSNGLLNIEDINHYDLYDFDHAEQIIFEVPYLDLQNASAEVVAKIHEHFAYTKEHHPELFI